MEKKKTREREQCLQWTNIRMNETTIDAVEIRRANWIDVDVDVCCVNVGQLVTACVFVCGIVD